MGLSAILVRIISPLVVQTRVLQARFARTTPRERVLLGGLILGALLYAPIAAIDWRSRQEDRYTAAQSDQSAARLALSASQSIAAQAPDQAAIEDMRTWGFEAGNVAIAQVQIEQQLVQAASAAQLINVRITTDPEIETIGPNQWLGGELQADLRWTPTFNFLESLAQWPEGFRVTQFRYEMTAQPNFVITDPAAVPLGRVQIGLAFPVKVPAVEPTT